MGFFSPALRKWSPFERCRKVSEDRNSDRSRSDTPRVVGRNFLRSWWTSMNYTRGIRRGSDTRANHEILNGRGRTQSWKRTSRSIELARRGYCAVKLFAELCPTG